MAVTVIGVTAFGLVAAMLLKETAPEHHKRIPQITVLRLPPPPPPKPEEKPPEPPKVKEEVHIEQPKPQEQPQQPDQAPPPGPLGIDAQGTGPGDGFGLVGRPGGRDITTIGSGSGGGSSLSQTLYGNGAARFLAQELARNPKLKSATYTIEVLLWISRDGRIERQQIIKGTGNTELDALIRDGLSDVGPYRQPMPEALPQPLRIRVTSSDA